MGQFISIIEIGKLRYPILEYFLAIVDLVDIVFLKKTKFDQNYAQKYRNLERKFTNIHLSLILACHQRKFYIYYAAVLNSLDFSFQSN